LSNHAPGRPRTLTSLLAKSQLVNASETACRRLFASRSRSIAGACGSIHGGAARKCFSELPVGSSNPLVDQMAPPSYTHAIRSVAIGELATDFPNFRELGIAPSDLVRYRGLARLIRMPCCSWRSADRGVGVPKVASRCFRLPQGGRMLNPTRNPFPDRPRR
jgi:hypothetical protein